MSFRTDFPILTQDSTSNIPFVYLDSAATTLTPESVTDAMDDYYHRYRSNTHRGLYQNAERATEKVESVRVQVADFFGVTKDEVIFTSGATAAANHIVLLIERNIRLGSGDEIVVSEFSHSSLLLPLQELARRTGAKIVYGVENLTPQTKVFATPLMSNVTGEIYDVQKMCTDAKKYGAFCICDATAAATHVQIGVKELCVDALFISAHKMFGPTGVGALLLRSNWVSSFEPVFFGGGMPTVVGETRSQYVEGVGKFEAGTLPIAEIIGFGAAITYIHTVGINRMLADIRELSVYAHARLSEKEYIHVYGANRETGIISFNVEGIHSHDVAQILADRGICIRAGTHCSHHTMAELMCNSTCRMSLHMYNTINDIDMMMQGIDFARETFKLHI